MEFDLPLANLYPTPATLPSYGIAAIIGGVVALLLGGCLCCLICREKSGSLGGSPTPESSIQMCCKRRFRSSSAETDS